MRITRSNTTVLKALSVNRSHKLMVKLTGKRDTGNPYVAFDVAGAGNIVMKTRQLSTLPVRGSPRASGRGGSTRQM